MSKAAKTVLAVLCAAALTGRRVSAQEADQAAGAPAGDAGQAEAGGAGMRPAMQNPFTFSPELRGSYTDNRDPSEADKESAFDFYVIPRIAIDLKPERTVLHLGYAPAFRYRSNPSDTQNDYDLLHSLQLSGDLEATPSVRLRLRENFDYSDDPSVEKQGVTVRENRNYILNRAEGGCNWRFAPWTDLDLYARHMIKRYDRTEAATDSDRDTIEAGAAIGRQVAPTVVVQLIGRMTSYGFESGRNVNRDFDLYFGGVRAEKKLNPTFRGAITLGYESSQYDDAEQGSSSSPFGAVEVFGDLLPVLHLNVGFTHGVREADVYPFASQDYDQFSGRVAWDVARLTLGLNGTYRLSSYDADVAATGAQTEDYYNNARSGDETTIVVGVSAKIKLTEQSAITLAQTYEDVDSDVYLSFTKNTTSVSLTASF